MLAGELRKRLLIQLESAKYKLALHNWDEPIKRLTAKAKELNVISVTPYLGQTFYLDEPLPKTEWWLNI